MTVFACALLAALVPAAASAAPHRVDVKVLEGFRPYSLSFQAQEGGRASSGGPAAGAPDRTFQFDYSLTPEGGAFRLQFWLSLTANGGGRGMSQSGTVVLRPGSRKRVLDCGHWKAELGLDLPAKASAKDAEPTNHWLSLKTSGTLGAHRCLLAVGISGGGGMSDFVSSPSGWDQKILFSLKESFPAFEGGAGEPTEGGSYGLSYDVQAERASMHSGLRLMLGRAEPAASSEGARVEFLLTREPKAARAAPKAAVESSVVPLLR
jgi:hypothetical protein